MTSERKAQANRANAKNSTGPKTARGKVPAAGNARRLGLSVPVLADPVLSGQVAALTRAIAGEVSDGNRYELARIAEAQIDLQRVHQARHQFFADRLQDLGQANPPKSASSPNSTSLDPHKFAAILVQHSKEIKAIDRSKRRALSRRRFAIRAFDA
jgi:hypothetical protein